MGLKECITKINTAHSLVFNIKSKNDNIKVYIFSTNMILYHYKVNIKRMSSY